MPRDSACGVREAAGVCRPPISAAVERHLFALCPLHSAQREMYRSVPSPFREAESHGHAQMERGFLVEPDLPREIIDELFDELMIGFVDELFQALDNLFLPLHVGGGEQLVIMQRLEQLVVFDRTLLFDIAEARVTYAVVGHIDPLGSRARNVHEVVRSGAHHCLPGKGYYNLERESEICKLEAASDARSEERR